MAISTPGKRHKVYSVPELLALEDDPDRWIVPGVIPVVGRTIVYGDGGTGKTTIIMDLAIAVASNGLMLKQFPVHKFGPVLFVSTEGSILDNRDRVMTRIRSHGVDPSLVQFYFCQEPFDMDNPADVAELRSYMQDLQPRMVVWDPLDSFIRGDENSAKETKQLRRKADDIIHDFQTSLLVIHHENKQGGIRGSSAWKDWTDTELHVTVKEMTLPGAGPVKVVTVDAEKVRNGRDGKVFSVVALASNTAGGLEYEYYDGQNAEAISQAWLKQQVYKTLLEAPLALTTKEVASLLGVSQPKTAAALEALEATGLADHNGSVIRPSNTEGTRTRAVPAWRVARRMSLVDAVAAILQYQKQRIAEDTEMLTITPLVPASAPAPM